MRNNFVECIQDEINKAKDYSFTFLAKNTYLAIQHTSLYIYPIILFTMYFVIFSGHSSLATSSHCFKRRSVQSSARNCRVHLSWRSQCGPGTWTKPWHRLLALHLCQLTKKFIFTNRGSGKILVTIVVQLLFCVLYPQCVSLTWGLTLRHEIRRILWRNNHLTELT